MTVATLWADRDAHRAIAGTVDSMTATSISVTVGKYSSQMLARFPIGSLPASAVISAVSLNYYADSGSNWLATENSIVQEVTSAWTESPGGEAVTLGTAYDFLALLYNPASAGWKSISDPILLSMVQAWKAGTLVNNGLAITGDGGTVDEGDTIAIRTKEFAPVGTFGPYLSVTYTTSPNAPAWGATPVAGTVYDLTVPYVVTGSDPDGDPVTADIAYSVDGTTWVTAATAVALSGNLNSSAWPDSTTLRLRARLRDSSGNLSGYTVDSRIFTVRHTSYVKVWTGAAWVLKPLRRWNGSAWVNTRLKRWTGSAWVDE